MFSRPPKILIIDDDVELVTLLVDYLTLEGFATTPSHSGPAGLAALAKDTFDLIILDVMMPGDVRDRSARKDPRDQSDTGADAHRQGRSRGQDFGT